MAFVSGVFFSFTWLLSSPSTTAVAFRAHAAVRDRSKACLVEFEDCFSIHAPPRSRALFFTSFGHTGANPGSYCSPINHTQESCALSRAPPAPGGSTPRPVGLFDISSMPPRVLDLRFLSHSRWCPSLASSFLCLSLFLSPLPVPPTLSLPPSPRRRMLPRFYPAPGWLRVTLASGFRVRGISINPGTPGFPYLFHPHRSMEVRFR